MNRARAWAHHIGDAMDRWWPTIAIAIILAAALSSTVALHSAHRASSSANRVAAEAKALAMANARLTRRTHQLELKLATEAHAAIQQNVTARFDDCLNGDGVRAQLFAQTLTAKKTTDRLLFKLLPSLDTPQVHQLVDRAEAKQLAAYKPRGRTGCGIYALRAVPVKARAQYRIPGT